MAKSKRKKPTAKKVLVTGGLGFIGTQVVKQLQSKKYHVEIADALTTYGVLDKEELEYLYNERITNIDQDTKIHKVDIADLELTNALFEQLKPDYVIHLASFPNEKLVSANPVEAAHTMCQGLATVLDNCLRHKVKRILYVSSSMVLGDFSFPADESHTPKPTGGYAIWKHAGEQIVHQFSTQHGLDYVTVRPSAVYGPLDNGNRVIGKFLLNAMRDRTLSVNGVDEKLDFTYVDDLARGIVDALAKGKKGIYHLTRGQSVTIKEAAETVVKIVGKGSVAIKPRDKTLPSRGTLDISRAKTDFKFDPKINIEKGIKLYYEWLRNSVYWSEKTI